jgi:hypothetical protein
MVMVPKSPIPLGASQLAVEVRAATHSMSKGVRAATHPMSNAVMAPTPPVQPSLDPTPYVAEMGVSPLTPKLKDQDQVLTLATALEATLAATPQVLSPLTVNLGEEMSSLSHAMMMGVPDSDAAAFPTSTSSLKHPNPTTDTG